ncbi:MAG TPA: acyl-CoA thioesterase/bile acid-CoA:amino acid N-acyltransferase family protein [Candidatus Dormibacteraeota bacterium]|nr:acyl-CoA thioesterase/bile acid-CoA:amino acid N-acyltransferase family protein [Candidatus Dormibacteraeota bacterium]
MRRPLAFLALGLQALAASMACSSGNHGPVAITVDKSTTLLSSPVHVVVTGLNGGESATIAVTSTDLTAHVWSASATFNADSNGTIDLSRTRPSAGTYSQADGMGLFWSMRPKGAAPLPTFLGPQLGNEVDRITVTAGAQPVATTVVRQLIGPGITVIEKRTPVDSFYGDYFAPADVSTRKPAVLIFGGSEGGLSGTFTAAQLASLGYPALAVAYFAEPGLPSQLLNVPLEYFAGALNWLGQQPGVDSGHLIIMGVSRGGEAALLIGATFPDLVHGVAALVPSAWVNCSFPACSGSAWTVGGRPVPFTGAASDAAALIPVGRIHGPVFVDCGAHDYVWPSCLYANKIKAELATGFTYPQTILEFPDAGHGIGALVPFRAETELSQLQGLTPASNPVAREQAWPQFLKFLSAIARG